MDNRYRVLRTKEVQAHSSHRCDHCDEPIWPGDTYLLKVSAIRKGKYRCLRVEKEHINPPCPPDDRDEEPIIVQQPVLVWAQAA